MKNISYILVSLIFCLMSCTARTDSSTQVAVGPELNKFLSKSQKPAVIKFYADWCSSCKEFQPSFLRVSKSMSGQVDFYEIDIDKKENKALIKELKIARIPETIFVSKTRTIVMRKLGVISDSELNKQIQQISNR
jgi:thioredoxin:protein disulfide reductase